MTDYSLNAEPGKLRAPPNATERFIADTIKQRMAYLSDDDCVDAGRAALQAIALLSVGAIAAEGEGLPAPPSSVQPPGR